MNMHINYYLGQRVRRSGIMAISQLREALMRLLLADDEREITKAVRTVLEHNRYTVDTVDRVRDAAGKRRAAARRGDDPVYRPAAGIGKRPRMRILLIAFCDLL